MSGRADALLQSLIDIEDIAANCPHHTAAPAAGTPESRLHKLSGHVNTRGRLSSKHCNTCTLAKCAATEVATEVNDVDSLKRDEGFHWIGRISEKSLEFAPKKKESNSNQRMFENPIAREMLVEDGTPQVLFHASGAHRGLALRFSSETDVDVPAEVTEPAPVPAHLAEAVALIETTPFRYIAERASAALADGTYDNETLMRAAVLAVNRNAELVADHHGGPLHPTAGAWAIFSAAELLKGDEAWSGMATMQLVAIAARHIEISRKLAGPALLPNLPTESTAHITDATAAVTALREAIAGNRPNQAEALLLKALELEAPRDELLSAIMEQGVPRHVVDDHFTLYPIFAFHSLDLLGWELAPVVLRQVVRYLATVPPVARDLVDKEGFSLIAKQGVGGDSDWARVSEICERLGLLEDGGVREVPEEGVDETGWAEDVARAIAEDVLPGVWNGDRNNADVGINDDDIFLRMQDLLAEAMAEGLSVQGALNALSLGAVRLYLRNDIGNPFDVHFLTGVASRRVMCAANVPTRLKVLSILLWGSGFEVTQRYLFYPVNFTHNEQFGADKIPPRGAALDASAVADHDALLDRISNKIVERRELVLSPLGEPTSHEQQMWKIYAGEIPVTGAALGDVVPEELWPMVWRYDHDGGDLEAFFRRLALHTAMDDYTEMHLVKHTISSYRECLAMPRHLRWLYMCAATKAVCNSSGLGHTVFDTAAPILKAQAPFAGWTPVQYDGDKPAPPSV